MSEKHLVETNESSESSPLRGNRDFRRLWVSGALSDIGSSASSFATPLLVLALTGSPLLAGFVGSAGLAGFVVFALPAGAVVDRWDRRRLMLAADGLRMVAAAVLVAAIVTGSVTVPILVVVAVIASAGAALFGPAHAAAIRHLVPPGQLATASATDEARGMLAELAGPPLGGTLFAAAQWMPYVADTVSFLASLLAVARLRVRLSGRQAAPTAVPARTSVGEGLRFVWREPFLRTLLVVAPLGNTALVGLLLALVVTLRQRGLGATGIGLVQALVMGGGLLGAVLAGRILTTVTTATLIVTSSWITAAAVASMVILPGTYLLAAPLFVLMLLVPATNGAFFARQVQVTPDHLQGRVQGATGMLSQALSPVGPLLAGTLIELTGQRGTFAVLAALLATAALIVTASPATKASLGRHRHADDP